MSLKLRLPATRVAPLAVGSAPAPFLSRRAKSLSGVACQRHPGLKITGRSFEREKRCGGEGREAIGLEVVELDEGHAGAVRPHDDVALLGGRKVEHRRQLLLELGGRHVAAEQFLDAGARRPRHIEMRGADAGKEIEHPLPVMQCCAVSRHYSPPCLLLPVKLLLPMMVIQPA